MPLRQPHRPSHAACAGWRCPPPAHAPAASPRPSVSTGRTGLQHRFGQFRQRDLGLAQDGDLLRIVLRQFPRIGVQMDDREVLRHRLDLAGQRQGEQVGADRDQQVVLRQHATDRLRQPHQRAAIQRMRRREHRPAGHALVIDRRAQRLGQRHQFPQRIALRAPHRRR